MKKIISLLLAVCMLFSLAACGQASDPEATTPAATDPTTPAATTPATTTEPPATTPAPVTVDNPAIYFSMTIGDNDTGAYVSLTAMEMDPGEITVEYVGDVKKVGTFDPSVMHAITAELEKTGLSALNGQSEYSDGAQFASMFIQYADDSTLSADYSGAIPAEFTDGYDAMETVFAELTVNLDVYVPQPMVMGEVNADALAEMTAILNGSGIETLDSFAINDIPLDDSFAYTAGLSGYEGILHGTSCAPMMLASAYSLVIVRAESADAIASIRADFAASMDWAKWICVSASYALIAQKGDWVLCLMGTGDQFTRTAQGITAAGWESAERITNPNF